MRSFGLSVCVVLLCASALAAPPAPQKKQSPAEAAHAAKMAKVDEVAKEIFSAADRNHNDLLSRGEFSKAEPVLEEAIYALGMSGALGQVQTGTMQQQTLELDNKAYNATPNLVKNNKISLAQFVAYAHGMAAEADVEFAQNRAAMQQLQKNYRNRRGRQVHTGAPIFVSPF